MEDLLVHDLTISSYTKNYTVTFDDNFLSTDIASLGTHFVVDKNVIQHLGHSFYQSARRKSIYLLEATEENKSYDQLGKIINHMIENGLQRDSHLVAIGGGITQDITCFIASVYMRGLSWSFVPTTLLAQADSCIGSKSSVNFGTYKNLLGTFNPPNRVFICNKFLRTLTSDDFLSGVGEIAKLFLLNNKTFNVNDITVDNVSKYVSDALLIKKHYIEIDEFDKGVRNLLNYGHCLGHAIESATNFKVPHGIAVAMGMDAVNKFALLQGFINQQRFDQLHAVVYPCYQNFKSYNLVLDQIMPALYKDKKNTGNVLNFILPVGENFEKRGFERNNQTLNDILSCLELHPT